MQRKSGIALCCVSLLTTLSVRSADAAPTLVQNPALPTATATFTATLDGVILSPPIAPGGGAVAGPSEVFVPIDGTTTAEASAITTNALTPFQVPSVTSDSEASVTNRTSRGSAVTHVRDARAALSCSIRIVATGPISNPPAMLPVIFAGQLGISASRRRTLVDRVARAA